MSAQMCPGPWRADHLLGQGGMSIGGAVDHGTRLSRSSRTARTTTPPSARLTATFVCSVPQPLSASVGLSGATRVRSNASASGMLSIDEPEPRAGIEDLGHFFEQPSQTSRAETGGDETE
jgi:hypothetical protein